MRDALTNAGHGEGVECAGPCGNMVDVVCEICQTEHLQSEQNGQHDQCNGRHHWLLYQLPGRGAYGPAPPTCDLVRIAVYSGGIKGKQGSIGCKKADVKQSFDVLQVLFGALRSEPILELDVESQRLSFIQSSHGSLRTIQS